MDEKDLPVSLMSLKHILDAPKFIFDVDQHHL